MPRDRSDPNLVTGARDSRPTEVDARKKRYVVTMGFRTLATAGAIVLFVTGFRWEGAILIAISVFAPIAAVIAANNHGVPQSGSPAYFDAQPDPSTPQIDKNRTIDL